MPRPIQNPPNPWAAHEVEYLEEPPAAKLEIYEERARSALSENKSPDVPFRFSVNPYRGCLHACAYCYARPTHEYLGFGAGTDFDRRLVVKTNIAEVLARELDRPSWAGATVVFSGNTDCYQPLEASYRLTRACLEVLRDRANPFAVITKGALIRRDVDVLGEAARRAKVVVTVSIPFVSADLAALVEPWASRPLRRLEALRALSDAGVETCVAVSPIIPGLNDDQIAEILTRAKEAGARRAFMTLLRLPRGTDQVFEERLRSALPDRAERVLSNLDDARAGNRKEARFGARMTGSGPRWAIIEQLFRQQVKRLGFETGRIDELSALEPEWASKRSAPPRRQLGLFDDVTRGRRS